MKSLLEMALRLRCWLIAAGLAAALAAQAGTYDPLQIADAPKLSTLDLIVIDSPRQREIPLRIYLPANNTPAPLLLFSHGLGGSRTGNPYLGEHWSARGYFVVVMQHHGSDEGVWRGMRPDMMLAALKRAANLDNALLRFADVSVVIDRLEKWNRTADLSEKSAEQSALIGRMDLSKIGMSGHSFGAVTAQAVSGQRSLLGDARFTDRRIKAAVVMSPSAPEMGDPQQIFAGVNIPWLVMTGTNDVTPSTDVDVESRRAVYAALPPGNKYELVLKDAEHNAFGDRALPGEKLPRNPNHHRVILALSTAFWDAYLREDVAAKAWLNGPGAASVLEQKDLWQRK